MRDCTYETEYEHLHSHLRRITRMLTGIGEDLARLAQLEIIHNLEELSSMAKQAEEISKLGGRFDELAAAVTDIHADYEALRAAMEADRENLSADGQAALDAAQSKADATRQLLVDLDVAVGDADGSDTPPADGGEPAPTV